MEEKKELLKNFLSEYDQEGKNPALSMREWDDDYVKSMLESGLSNLKYHMEVSLKRMLDGVETGIMEKIHPASAMGMVTSLQATATAAMELARRVTPDGEDPAEKAINLIDEMLNAA